MKNKKKFYLEIENCINNNKQYLFSTDIFEIIFYYDSKINSLNIVRPYDKDLIIVSYSFEDYSLEKIKKLCFKWIKNSIKISKRCNKFSKNLENELKKSFWKKNKEKKEFKHELQRVLVNDIFYKTMFIDFNKDFIQQSF